MREPQYICIVCNAKVAAPRVRHGLRYCHLGHRLSLRLGWASRVGSFREAFLYSLATAMVFLFAAGSWFPWSRSLSEGFLEIRIVCFLGLLIVGANGFWIIHQYKKRGGVILSLIPRMAGISTGYLVAATVTFIAAVTG